MGEQSNAYRILLRYDRKSRHRRIKKRRRYERLAATSQFLGTYAGGGEPPARSRFPATRPVDATPSRVGVARTLSGQRAARSPPTPLASVGPPSPFTAAGECGRVGCGLSLSGGFLAARRGLPGSVTAPACYHQPGERSPHPGVLPRAARRGAAGCVTSQPRPPSVMEGGAGLGSVVSCIPPGTT